MEEVFVIPGISLILSIVSALFRESEPSVSSFVFDLIYGSINLFEKNNNINIFIKMRILKVETLNKYVNKALGKYL